MASLNTTRIRKPAPPPQGGIAPQVFEPSNSHRTYEGAPAAHISVEQQLRRSVCSCLLWEDEFYEDGKTIADRIVELVGKCEPQVVADLAHDTRSSFNLRHIPLLLCAAMAAPGKGGTRLIGDTIANTIQRPDEISEFVAIYAKIYGVKPSAVKKRLSAQVKKGLAAAFRKFDQYQLAKYFSASGEKTAAVRGRDVMFMAHPKPADEAQAELWRRIAKKEAVTEGGADTWETALSSGADKKETFTRLLTEQKLGYLALLRNLRNMVESGVDTTLISEALVARRGGARRVLPFRYVAAARACPSLSGPIETALLAAIADMEPLTGVTMVLVDVSGSMDTKLSGKSDLTRMDAAATLAAVIPGDTQVFTFSDQLVGVRPEHARGLAGVQAIVGSQGHGGTRLGAALAALPSGLTDRLIVITDEQSHDHVTAPAHIERCYMINTASNQHGVGYGPRWTHIDGFSEQVIRFVREFETF